MPNHSYENDFDLHENETECRTHFHKKGSHLDSFGKRGTRELGNGLSRERQITSPHERKPDSPNVNLIKSVLHESS